MRTTELFAELLVIGAGGVAAVVTITLGLFTEMSWDYRQPVWILGLALAGMYLVGIVLDRIADELFDALRLAGKHFQHEREAYRNTRDRVLRASPRALELFNYSKRRQRICRAWTLTATVLAVSAPWCLLRRGAEPETAMWCAAGFLTLAVACFVCWRVLKRDEVQEIARLDTSEHGRAATEDPGLSP